MSDRKMKLLLVITAFVIIILGGTTIAFFNYTRTGSANTIRTGRIYFTSSQSNTINLTNVFPISSDDLSGDVSNHSTVTITVQGDTMYTDGIEYLISAVDVTNTINGKKIPFGVNITTSGSLGNNDTDYFTNRGGNNSLYKNVSGNKLSDGKQLVVGYITSGATGINGTINITAYIDGDKIAITDTPDENSEWQSGRNIFTTTEWNSLNTNGISFKIKVEANEGIWVNEEIHPYNIMQSNADITTTINFANVSSSTNGEGIYRLSGTESDTYPIYYYRGAIDNNNVLFGGYCWQMVRTTDTGGTKMIYNGLPDVSLSGSNITYNCGTTRDIQNTIMSTTDLSQSTGYYYADDYEIVSTSGNSVTYRLKAGTSPITQVAIADATAASSNIPTIATNYPYTCKQNTETGTCTVIYKVDSYASGTNANVYSSLDRSIIGRSVFNSNYQSVSDVGYMSNTRYPYSTSNWTTNALFASDATWVTDHYELSDASVTTLDTTHHYSCNATSADATCTSLRYVYYVSGTTKYYITLTNGDLIEDALYKMTGNGSNETKTKNASYVLNQNNSTAKETIDNWYRTNLTSEVNASNPDYSTYLEDTIFCNDRSYKTVTGNTSYPTYENSGWNKAGGDLTMYLYFGTLNRWSNSWYSTSNVPNMTCPNETDRFTVSNANGNGALTYPVGLLTADEIILAGVGGNNGSTSTYYLYTNDNYWSLSPNNFYLNGYANEFYVYSSGNLNRTYVISAIGLRPVVSLKHDIEFENGGDGTPLNPYVVKMEE